MSMSQNYNYQDNILTPKTSSIRQGDSTRRLMFNSGIGSFNVFQKKGDDNLSVSIQGQDDRWLMEQDSINQTHKTNNISLLNKTDLKYSTSNQRQPLLSMDKLNQLDTQFGIVSPKSIQSPKESLRSYSQLMQSQQNSGSEYGFRNGGNVFLKSKTAILKRSFTKGDSLEESPKKDKSTQLRKSKTQKFIDDSKTENNQQSNSNHDLDINNQITDLQLKSIHNNGINQNEQQQSGLKKIWKQKGFKLITQVRKFVLIMQNLSFIRRFNKQTQHQFEVINDLSAYYDPHMRIKIYSSRGCLKQILFSLKQFFEKNLIYQKLGATISSKMRVFEPDNYYFITFMTIMICCSLLLLFFNPIFMAFQDEMKEDGYLQSGIVVFCMGRLPLLIFLTEIAVRLNTAYYKRGLIIQQRWNIARHYIKHQVWYDLASVLLFSVYDISNINILMLITLLLIKKLIQITKELEDSITLDKKKYALYQLGKLSLFVTIIANICGCIFWSIGKNTQKSYDVTWIINEKLSNSPFYEKYVSCLYWATVTMLTVGYGDISPKNKVEKQFVIIIMIFSCGIYAYSFNQIGVLIEEITYDDKEFKQIYSQLAQYMKRRNLDVKIQTEVKRYYQYLHWEKLKYSINGELMLNPLKHSLKQKVVLHINYQLLEKNKMFRLQFSIEFLQKLAIVMKEKEFMPDDTVWSSNDLKYNNNKLFFLIRGQILQKVNDQFTVKVIEDGGFFNEKCFIIDEASNVSFVSTCISTLAILDKQDFLDVIHTFPNDYQIYCKIRDQSKNQQNLSVLDSKCETCEQFSHQFRNCPQVNYLINKEKLIYSLNHSVYHYERKPYIRRPLEDIYNSVNSEIKNSERYQQLKYKRINALMHRSNILENIIDFMIEKNPLNLDEDTLIEYMKIIVEKNEGLDENVSPEQNKYGQQQLAQNNEKHKSIIIHPVQMGGSKLQDDVLSPNRSNQQFPKFDEINQKEQESYHEMNNYNQQHSKTSSRGKQSSLGGGLILNQSHPNFQQNNTPLGSKESGQHTKRLGNQNYQSKTTSQTEISSNENLKELPNETDIRHGEKQRKQIEPDYGRGRVSTTTRSQYVLGNNSLSHNGSQYQHQMGQSSGIASFYSAPAVTAEINNSNGSNENNINYDNYLLYSNEQDEVNIPDALKMLKSKGRNQIQNQQNAYANHSTFTILEEETQENQTNVHHNLHQKNNIDLKNNNSNFEFNMDTSQEQTDLFPKGKDDLNQQLQTGKLILDSTDFINTSQNYINNNHPLLNLFNNNSLQNYQSPGNLNTPNNHQNIMQVSTPQRNAHTKRGSIQNRYLNYIRSSSANNPLSPMSKKNNKAAHFGQSDSREDGLFLRMSSQIMNSRGGSQHGIFGDETGMSKINSIRARNKTQSSFKQPSQLKNGKKIKDDDSLQNKLKQGSVNYVPSLQNFYGNLFDEQKIIIISPKTHDFSDLPDLDKHCIFVDYFPNNNIDKIMKQLAFIYLENVKMQGVKKKKETQMSKLEKIMLKFNSKRSSSKHKTSRQSVSPLRSKHSNRSNNQQTIPVIKSVFHQQSNQIK